mmetsp:Transcript_45270/g.72646  ORF Transcript_45270/g.72646 Transcript_45270/m.72646 type:complete len:461 (+) Transcript_45270:407-1789(+)
MFRRVALGGVRNAGAMMGSSGRIGMYARGFSSLPSHTTLLMPALSPTMTEGVIANWLKAPGDEVEAGQPVCEIETDKATVDFEVQDDGILAKILTEAGGSPIPVGSVIGVIVEEAGDVAAFANVTAEQLGGESTAPAASAPAPAAPAPAAPAPAVEAAPAKRVEGARVFASPFARKIAVESGVEISAIAGTGPNGRIVAADVQHFLTLPAAEQASAEVAAASTDAVPGAPAGGLGFIDYPVTADAQALAKQMELSKHEIPHYYLNSEIDISELLSVREQLNANLAADEHVSVNDFVVRAAAIAMNRVPDVNASWGKTFIRKYDQCDINVAVIDSEGENTVMPVIRGANNKGLSSIAKECKMLMDPESDEVDFGVGTFTISNMGSFGVKAFTPIVRQPQAASLGVGTITKRAIPGADGEVKIVSNMTVTLSCDHRVVDGAVSAGWLQEFKSLLQNPMSMLL